MKKLVLSMVIIGSCIAAKEKPKGQMSLEQQVYGLQTQVYALQDRASQLEAQIKRDKRSSDQVLINIIKRIDNFYNLLIGHTHEAKPMRLRK